jgi:hypothetical protein
LGLLVVFVTAGLGAAWSVHTEIGYAREDWRSLAALLRQQPAPAPAIGLSEPESIVPLQYYDHAGPLISKRIAPTACAAECWYVLRQSYAGRHSFGQGVVSRPSPPDGFPDCRTQLQWASPTGLTVWKVECSDRVGWVAEAPGKRQVR